MCSLNWGSGLTSNTICPWEVHRNWLKGKRQQQRQPMLHRGRCLEGPANCIDSRKQVACGETCLLAAADTGVSTKGGEAGGKAETSFARTNYRLAVRNLN